MSAIRPEATAALLRWRDVLVGGALIALGLYWILVAGGLLYWIGFAVVLAGGALTVAGIQRARFRQGGGGPGVVTVVEGRIGYFGPLSGGVIDLEDMTQLRLDPSERPAHWHLRQPGQPELAIPVNAEGADLLFDVFATLPGMRTEYMLRLLEAPGDHPVVIWQAASDPQVRRRLH